ncbi:hypothetical protein [Rhizobium sp. BR 314]|uniref:hypothetical protein n=1 Tax=Rhizobium sp. BR 314 TaxID=3040013 RepID=UPI0039BFF2FF
MDHDDILGTISNSDEIAVAAESAATGVNHYHGMAISKRPSQVVPLMSRQALEARRRHIGAAFGDFTGKILEENAPREPYPVDAWDTPVLKTACSR